MISSEPVYTLADLETWKFDGTALAVLGHPIKHSLSPPMHNAALAEFSRRDSRFATWKYFRFDVLPADLPRALELFHARRFHGLNLTVPHKVIAFDHVAEVDPAARTIGAVNTLLRSETGWRGFNTDGYGLASGIQQDLGHALSQHPVILLGAGGAARGAAVECVRQKVSALWIGNRTAANRDALIEALRPLSKEVPITGFSPEVPPPTLPARALVINATSAGLRAEDPPPIALDVLPRPIGVYDMIYNPPRTRLLAQAETLSLPAANGLSMLVHQGARALEIWTGEIAPAAVMEAAARVGLGSGG